MSWGTAGEIVYTPSFVRGLYAIPASGGEPRRLTAPQAGQAHVWPQVLPDGKTVVFTVWMGKSWDQASIGVLALDTGEWDVVVESAFFARYAAGHLIYLRGSTLFAAPFDIERQRLVEPATAVLEGVSADSFSGAGAFAVSPEGSIVYASGSARFPNRSLVWVDRAGRRSSITSTPGPYSSPRISPDGRRIALFQETAVVSLWVYEISRDALTRVSFGSDDHNTAWSPDGTRIAFESGREEFHQIYFASTDSPGDAVRVTEGESDHYLCDWSPDGRTLAYVEFHPETNADLWVTDVGDNSPTRAFSNTPFYEKQAAFSPDGHWLAYVSDESGRFEVYVQRFPGPGRKWIVSRDGGEEPAWSRSGKELFYRSSGNMMSVEIDTSSELTAGIPQVLFEGLFHYAPFPTRTYDVAPDGRFVMVSIPEMEMDARDLQVVLNWARELGPLEH